MVSLNAYSYNGVTTGGSKLYVPVQPASVIYSHFEHVSGFAARANQNTVSVSKIQILNSLLSQLVTMKTAPKVDVKPEQMNDAQIDTMIKDFQGKIQTSIQTAKTTGYGLAGVAPQTGAIFSLDA